MTIVASPPRIVASVRTFVEVSQFGASPLGTMALADMGAEVIEIEDRAAGGAVSRYVPMIRLAIEQVAPETGIDDVTEGAVAPPWMTILHNCECHTFEQVVRQLQKAITCSEADGWEIAWQVHNTGKAVVKVGPEAECVRVGNVLASIGLVVTVVQS